VHLDQCLVEELEYAVSSKHGFEIRSHVLEIFGICKDCKEKSKAGKKA
jgi:Fe2+ or Zn2+ uptake regulation protein